MGAVWTTEALALLRFLADRQWRPMTEALNVVGATIPPGRALRWYERRLEYRRRSSKTQVQEVLLDEDERIRYGKKGLAERVVQGLKRRNLDVRDDGDERMVRLRPEAVLPRQLLGLDLPGPVAPEVPEQAHDDNGGGEPATEAPQLDPEDEQPDEPRCGCEPAGERQEMALFAEDEVRALVSEEVRSALDDFQSGMQTWLMERFEQVERQVLLGRARDLASWDHSQ